MTKKHYSRKTGSARQSVASRRLMIFHTVVILFMGVIWMRLLVLQVLSHDFYSALANNQHSIFAELLPERGTVYLSDPKSRSGVFPAVVNKDMTFIYASPVEIEDPEEASSILAPILELDGEAVLAKLSRKDDPYEPLKRKVPNEVAEQVEALGMAGIGFVQEPNRFYPERSYLSQVIGFVGSNEKGEKVGRYGIEGYWESELAGEQGYLQMEGDPVGRLIGSVDKSIRPAIDGADFTLTIDRTIQYIACDRLESAVGRYGAAGGTVVIMDPKTGAVLAMCSVPNFDPNEFSSVEDMSVFNNPAIFTAYEPGSIFKPITMAAAIDAGKIAPSTVYNDEGEVRIGPYTIRNSDYEAHGLQTMTQVLEKSLNTGAIFAVGELGAEAFRQYVEDFGFGSITGIELDTERPGDVSSLSKRGDIWSATASYGQGITATPIQIVAAYGAIANGGKLMRTYIISEIRSGEGEADRTEPRDVRQVITKRAASLVGGMMARVVENGHGKRAGVPGYYVAGKTGTAQISREGSVGYEEGAYIGSFVGFAPVDDPAFVMLVKIDRPQGVQFAESTAAPLFGEIAAFLLQYMQIPPERPL